MEAEETPLCAWWGQHFNFSVKTDGGSSVHGESYGMPNSTSCVTTILPGSLQESHPLSPATPHPREMKWRISLPALAGLLENPGLNQEACLWYSSLSRKYYRCHFVAPKLLTRQHSYLIRHSTAIHIYLYLNSCPLYYTAGHASAPTPPY